MTWFTSFDERLLSWQHLRGHAAARDLESALLDINDWWWQAPMVSHTLSWQDSVDRWPDPWSLLSQNGYCDLARALGMLYTVIMCEHQDVKNIELCQTNDFNLVRINEKKYILNWSPGTIVNNQSSQLAVKQSVDVNELKKYIR